MTDKKIIIIAGGTGGHIFPGITIATGLLKKQWKVHWIGTRNHIESVIIPRYNIPIDFISINSLTRNSLHSMILTTIQLIKSYKESDLIISSWKPKVILTMGGYVSAPGGLVAYKRKIPLIIHEQNTIGGLTNIILNKLSYKTLQAFPNTFKNAIVVGNPIRSNILNIASPSKRFKNRKGPIRILVLGGSQGANVINQLIPQLSQILKEKILIWHQIGHNVSENLKNFYNVKRKNIFKKSIFIQKIHIAYAWADLVLTRGGALTVSEITTVGLPAIFIPYPHQDKQQYWNVLPLYKSGAAKIIDQKDLNITILIKLILQLNRKKLFSMAKKSKTNIHFNSTEKIIQIIEQAVL